MGNDRLRLAEAVEDDWRALNDEERSASRQALLLIDDDPIVGTPLFEPLRGLWSYRTDGLRIIYRIVSEARFVLILAIARVEERQIR